MDSRSCPVCSEALEPDAAFCTTCGTRVPTNAEYPTSSARSACCVHCGHPLVEGVAFCTNCGRAVSGASERPVTGPAVKSVPFDHRAQRAAPNRGWRRWLVVAIVLVALSAGGLGSWWYFSSSDTEVSPATQSAGGQASNEGGAAVTVDPVADAAVDEVDCSAVADTLATEVFAWAASLDAGLMRSGHSVPAAPTLEVDSACAPEGVLIEVSELIRDELSSGSGTRNTGLLSYLSSPEDPAGAITSAIESFPQRPPFIGADYPIAIPAWIVVLESLETAENSQSQAETRARSYDNLFSTVTVIRSDDFVSLRTGYWAIIASGFAGFDDASSKCIGAGLSSGECYPRLLQEMGDQSSVMGGCGLYGRFQAVSTANVMLHPRIVSHEKRGSLNLGEEVFATGPQYSSSDGNWIPVLGPFEDGNRMGWVKSSALVVSPECVDHSTIPAPDTCVAIGEDAVAALTGPNQPADELEMIVARASRAACDPAAVNESVSTGLAQFQTDDPVLRLRVSVWSTIPLLVP